MLDVALNLCTKVSLVSFLKSGPGTKIIIRIVWSCINNNVIKNYNISEVQLIAILKRIQISYIC